MNPQQDAALAARLLAWLRPRQDEMASVLSELVAIATENPPGTGYRECTDVLEARLRSHSLTCERHTFTPEANPPASLDVSHPRPETEAPITLIATHGHGDHTVYFHGHYDVVPAYSPKQFSPLRKDNFLFGRGSCDMKGGIVSMLYAILALKELRIELNGRIALTLVPDEETGGARGSGWLARQGLLGKDAIAMLLAEPTSGVVWNANRGAISLRIRAQGKSAHVGLQHQGQNAFERMLQVVERLQNLKKEVEQRTTTVNIANNHSRNSILMLGGQSGGGANFNVVPNECWFTVDRRINPEEDLQVEKARLIGVLEKCQRDGIPLTWEILQEAGSSASGNDNVAAQALSSSVQLVTGQPPSFELCPGLLETRFYAAKGIPSYAYGPGLLSVAHGPDEYVDLRKVCDCAAIYALTALAVLNPPT